jgi:hypothetical protein
MRVINMYANIQTDAPGFWNPGVAFGFRLIKGG